MTLKDRVAIITGAAQGVGRATAHRFAQDGARVVIADVNEAKGHTVAEELRSEGCPALFVATDVADEAKCEALAAATLEAYGRIDILVNDAAIFSTITMRPFWELSVAEWDQLMAVNVRGVWLASRAVLPAMRAQQYGRIVNISSAAIWMGRPNYLHYIASKGAVYAMTHSMAREVGDFGITVNSITPGATYTEVPRETVTPEQTAQMLQLQCIKRPEEPTDLVGVIAFLASEDAAFITGQNVNVDGGLSHR